jgi:CheY-like chemotaxis protein
VAFAFRRRVAGPVFGPISRLRAASAPDTFPISRGLIVPGRLRIGDEIELHSGALEVEPDGRIRAAEPTSVVVDCDVAAEGSRRTRRVEGRRRGVNRFRSVLAPGVQEDWIAASPDAVARELWHDRLMGRTVLIVDDHEAFRASATALLEAEGFAIVGEAADGGGAIAETERLRPQVVLLDIQLPDLDGFTVAERLTAVPDPPRVVLISSREAAAYGPRLRAAQATGFITKRELSGQALAALVG